MTELLSMRAYAKHRKCSHTAVAKAIAAGRLRARTNEFPTGSLVVEGGRTLIDPARADVEWSTLTDVAQQREHETRRGGNPKRGNPGNQSVATPEARVTQVTMWADAERAETNGAQSPDAAEKRSSYLEHRTEREALRVQREQLELERIAGTSIDVAEVRSETFAATREARDLLLGMIQRLTPSLAAESDPARVQAMLERELDVALASLVHLMEKSADGEAPERA